MTHADPRFRELDPRPDPIALSLVAARAAFDRAIVAFLAVPDGSLERDWAWTGESTADIRSAFYIALERLEQARGEVARLLVASGMPPGPATGVLTANTEARWDLHGVLAPLPDELLDADPGGREWTVRGTLTHIVASQRGYSWFNAWWLARRDAPDFPTRAPDALEAELPAEDEQGSGSMRQLRYRLDALVDLGTQVWQDASAADLAVRARWAGFPVTVGFRLGRPSAHITEHTVQVEKTLALLGRAPSEVERLVRLLHRAFGCLEGAVWGLPASRLEGQVGAELEAASSEVEALGRSLVIG